jgi:hypothetical protein
MICPDEEPIPIYILVPNPDAPNGAMVIKVNGTGFFSLHVPFEILLPGNCPGANSVDLQLSRSASIQTSSGDYSALLAGQRNISSGEYSAVLVSQDSIAGGDYALVGGGRQLTANGARATALGGENSNASGPASAAIGGGNNNSTGTFSGIFAGFDGISAADSSVVLGGMGGQTTNDATCSAIVGGEECITTYPDSVALGRYNETGAISNSERIFMVGYGTDMARSNLMSVTDDGNVHAQTAFLFPGADYAEYFESASGEAIQVGTVLTFKEGTRKVIPATNFTPKSMLIGVVSTSAGIVGNAYDEFWQGMYERDGFDNVIYKTVTKKRRVPVMNKIQKEVISEEVDYTTDPPRLIETRKTIEIQEPVKIEVLHYDVNGNPKVDRNGKPLVSLVPRMEEVVIETRHRKLSSNYDPTLSYISRSERPEWNVVGLVGVVKVRKDQPLRDSWIRIERGKMHDTVLIR